MKTFFTSDTHFGHANIIKYCNRPFASVEEMDNTLIHNWNAVVRPEDTVYHLGDFAVGGGPAAPYLRRLNGTIYFCLGNHDKRLRFIKAYLDIELELQDHFAGSYLNDDKVKFGIPYLREVTVEKQEIVLCHYAMKVWNGSHKGSWQLYGHSHGTLPDDPNALSCDVGVDCWNYFPVSMEQLRDKMKTKTYKPVDHHGPQTT
jgi:calcineurin-like phosphoesterase family protein